MNCLDSLAAYSSEIAMQAAANVIRSRRIDDPDFEALTSAIKARVTDALSAALADAREALDAGMGMVTEATWTTSFRLAGVQAVSDVYPQ